MLLQRFGSYAVVTDVKGGKWSLYYAFYGYEARSWSYDEQPARIRSKVLGSVDCYSSGGKSVCNLYAWLDGKPDTDGSSIAWLIDLYVHSHTLRP